MTISVGSGFRSSTISAPCVPGEIEVLATADAGADLAVEHADVVVDRIDDVPGEEDRDASLARRLEEARHLVGGSKGHLAAGKRILLGVVRCAADAGHVVLAVDEEERRPLAEAGTLGPAPALDHRAVLRRQQ